MTRSSWSVPLRWNNPAKRRESPDRVDKRLPVPDMSRAVSCQKRLANAIVLGYKNRERPRRSWFGCRMPLSPTIWPMIARRDLLRWAAAGVVDASVVRRSLPTAPDAGAAASPAALRLRPGRSTLRGSLPRSRIRAPAPALPAPFSNLTYEQYVAIKPKPGAALWANEAIGLRHRAVASRLPVFGSGHASTSSRTASSTALAYNAGQFDFGKLAVPDNLPDLGFSGFRVLHARSGQGLSDAAIFQGASFFRSLANGQNFGLTARALSIRTGDPKGEEFPSFTQVWIERPSPVNEVLVIHALVDSESMTGAYRFTLRPGDITIIDTECTLVHAQPRRFLRPRLHGRNVPVRASVPPRHRRSSRRASTTSRDCRSSTATANGYGAPFPIRRPCRSRPSSTPIRAASACCSASGVSRSLQDDDQHWEMRPSLWIEPINDWGEGSVALVEIPTDSENNDNVVCFWRPKAVLQPGAESRILVPPVLVLDAARPSVPRRGDGHAGRAWVDRASGGGSWSSSPASCSAIRSAERTFSPTLVGLGRNRRCRSGPSCRGSERPARVLFELDFGGETLSELRLVLESAGKPVSETWLYRWTA